MKRIALLLSTMLLAAPFSAAAPQAAGFQTLNTPAASLNQSCRSLAVAPAAAARPSGFYWIKFDARNSAVMYCNNETLHDGLKGGWTLVWSNLRGGKGKLTSDLHWGASTETLPRYRGPAILGSSPDLQAFEVFTGLKWWRTIMAAPNGRGELLYDWAHDYADQRLIDLQAACKFSLNSQVNWTVTFDTNSCKALKGSSLPNLFTYHNGRPWTTVDRDNDTNGANCAGLYSGNPWWYVGCWSGSISGGGEAPAQGHYNGAYWTGSDKSWGNITGGGAGNGWIFVR